MDAYQHSPVVDTLRVLELASLLLRNSLNLWYITALQKVDADLVLIDTRVLILVG